MTMSTTRGKMPSNNFSIDEALKYRSEAFAAIRVHAATISTIGSAIERFDEALTQALSPRSNDDRQSLIAATNHLASLLGNGGES